MVDTADAERILLQAGARSRLANGADHDSSERKDKANDGGALLHEYQANPLIQAVKQGVQRTLVPLFLMLNTPNLVILIWFCTVHCDNSYAKLAHIFRQKSLIGGLSHVWSHVHWPSAAVVWILVGYSAFSLALMRLVPGPRVFGPLTPKGHRPQYTDNGFACFLLTLLAFALLTAACKTWGWASPTIIYDRFDEVLLTLNIFSLLFCLLLYVKGLVAPSTSDSGSSGNLIFDYYWGTELYPRLLGFDVKVFTNCRFGMTVWALLVCVFGLKSYELHGGVVDSMLVSTLLQMLYFLKFFWWEAGYMCTIDIMVDRAGYYICWGCLVFVPGLYASVSLSLVRQPVVLGLPLSCLILALGVLAIYVNYDADRQKLAVRRADGDCLVWGRKAAVIRAKYRLESGEVRESVLLASGWWGLARHFHYVPEVLLSLCWSLPALFSCVLPYTYVIWLLLLLTHRSYRDDSKCSQKYGKFWAQYCQRVSSRIVPYVF